MNSPTALTEKARRVEVRLPPLHPQQREVAADPARFKVVCCGRQWGKTLLGAAYIVGQAAGRGGDYWWVAPSFAIGELGWRIIVYLAMQVPGTKVESRPVFRVTFANGATIQMRSADNPDSLRGATLNGVVFDEAALAKPEAWPTLRPCLSVRKGWAIFISTPKGLNWFHDLFEQAGARPGWNRWRTPSVDNPHIPPEDVEEARRGMSSLLFSQEYEAEFISTGSGMYRLEWMQHYKVEQTEDDVVYRLGEHRVLASSCGFFHTADLAWSQDEDADYTVIASWALTKKKHLLLVDVLRDRYEPTVVVPLMRRQVDRFGGHIVIERTARQLGVIRQAEAEGLAVREVKADRDKVIRAWPSAAWMEQRRLWFPGGSLPWWPAVEEEMLAFPAGRHDDFVDNLAYAVLEAGKVSAEFVTM